MIIRFTSAKGHINHGIVMARSDRYPGMIQVLWDRFDDLINDLRDRKRLKDNDMLYLGVRVSWVSTDLNPFAGGATSTDLLPIDTSVRWNTPGMNQIHQQCQANGLAWLQTEWPAIVKTFTPERSRLLRSK